MALNQHAANLVDTTVNAFNGDSTSISPMDGISLIDSWTSTLRDGGPDSNPVASSLSQLKTELQSGNPDGSQIQQILKELAQQVRGTAESADAEMQTKLSPLADALEGFSEQLGGSSKMAAMNTESSDTVMPGSSGGQAPMTSTVGGESTNSGTGTSALGTEEDSFSNRTGGTTENGSAMGMDDTTGSDGAQRKDGGEYSYGTGTGSEGDNYSAGSSTQSSGVSGGSAESGSGSSGGRSQY